MTAISTRRAWAFAALMLLAACARPDDTREPSLSAAGPLLPGGMLRGVSARDSQLIAVGRDSTGRGVVFLSNDGRQWTHVATQPSSLPSLQAVAAWRNGFVAFADSGAAILWTSRDGRAWTPTKPNERAFADAGVTDVAAGGPGLVAVGYLRDPGETDEPVSGLVWTSPDGATWTRVGDARTFDLTHGTINTVAVGGPGLVAAGSDINGSVVWISRDGASWERVPRDPAVFAGAGISAIAASRDGLVALGARIPDSAPERWVSRDGRAWARDVVEGPFSVHARVSDLSQLAGRLVGVGQDSVGAAIWTSDDGRSWTLVAGSR